MFTAIQGLNNDEKDLIPLIKDQSIHAYCWAYSLTSAIELKHALKTGNRLKFNPYGIIDNVLDFYAQLKNQLKDHPELQNLYDLCKEFAGKENQPKENYSPFCAINYLVMDQKRMIYEYNNESSNVYVSNATVLSIKTLEDLYETLKENKFISAAYYSEPDFYKSGPIITNYIEDENVELNHNIIITGVGTIYNTPGIFVEIVNSWGTVYYDEEDGLFKPLGYDGIYYLKVADNETAPLINNRKIFTLNMAIDTEEFESEQNDNKNENSNDDSKKYKILSIVLGVIAGVLLVLFIVFLSLYLANKGTKISDITNSSVF